MSNILVTETNSAAVVEQSLMAFAAGMKAQTRSDILHSYQFASRVASKAYPTKEQSEEWYKRALEVMEDLGWLTIRRTYEREYSESQSLTLGSIAFKAMKAVGQAAFGGPVSEALGKLAGDALESLGSITEPQEVLKRNLEERETGSIGLVTCLENSEGEVLMLLTAVSTDGMEKSKDTLVFEWKNTGAYNYSGAALLSFNTEHYARVREDVATRLGDLTRKNVSEYEI